MIHTRAAEWRAQRNEIRAANVTLVVSHFAVNTNRTPAHYPEIEQALAANLQLPLLGEVFVMYDHSPPGGCKQLAARLQGRVRIRRAMGKLVCRERRLQPTYEQMFAFASERLQRNRLILIANADVVFDETLAQLPPTPRGHVMTMTVNDNGRCRWQSRNVPFVMSWDAWAFRPPLPAGVRSAAAMAAFHTMGGFTMNAPHAENRAACALTLGGVTLHSACLLVRLQHVHNESKMHAPELIGTWTDFCAGEAYAQARVKGSPRPDRLQGGEGWPCEFYPLESGSGRRASTERAYAYVVNASMCETDIDGPALMGLLAERTVATDRSGSALCLLMLPEALILLVVCSRCCWRAEEGERERGGVVRGVASSGRGGRVDEWKALSRLAGSGSRLPRTCAAWRHSSGSTG